MSLYFEGHEHHVSIIKHRDGLECDACDRSFGDVISCGECKFTVHRKCVFMFDIQEIFDHPSHDGHCLKLLTTGAPDDTDQKCHLCGKKTKRLLYHCSDCKLNVDIDCIIDYICARSPLKLPWHHHPLIKVDLGANMPCDFCNESGIDYCCPRCRFMIHERCASVFDSPEITHPSHVRHPLKLLSNVRLLFLFSMEVMIITYSSLNLDAVNTSAETPKLCMRQLHSCGEPRVIKGRNARVI
ncbi:unnamed protein product [Arabidopsis thaliana]|uniref:(thale cress) hypothetical protein n=1 Tax=Arabidopsis thaliana TaxID=3702 RepID=A0A7G2FD71_ARATH|nr:unnamed protein product [Arabidopsis thaliana]